MVLTVFKTLSWSSRGLFLFALSCRNFGQNAYNTLAEHLHLEETDRKKDGYQGPFYHRYYLDVMPRFYLVNNQGNPQQLGQNVRNRPIQLLVHRCLLQPKIAYTKLNRVHVSPLALIQQNQCQSYDHPLLQGHSKHFLRLSPDLLSSGRSFHVC